MFECLPFHTPFYDSVFSISTSLFFDTIPCRFSISEFLIRYASTFSICKFIVCNFSCV